MKNIKESNLNPSQHWDIRLKIIIFLMINKLKEY